MWYIAVLVDNKKKLYKNVFQIKNLFMMQTLYKLQLLDVWDVSVVISCIKGKIWISPFIMPGGDYYEDINGNGI